MLILDGGPTAPAGETLAAGTRLVITFHQAYQDAAGVYPMVHTAALDVTNGAWKPVGAADGTAFEVPAASYGMPGPLVTFEERQVHADLSEVTSRREARLVEPVSGLGKVWYADPPASVRILLDLAGSTFRLAGDASRLAGALA
jgi:hypothetical protein